MAEAAQETTEPDIAIVEILQDMMEPDLTMVGEILDTTGSDMTMAETLLDTMEPGLLATHEATANALDEELRTENPPDGEFRTRPLDK